MITAIEVRVRKRTNQMTLSFSSSRRYRCSSHLWLQEALMQSFPMLPETLSFIVLGHWSWQKALGARVKNDLTIVRLN